MSHNVELKNLYLLWNMVTMKVWRTNLYIANWNPALWWAKLSIWNMCFIIPNKHGRSLNLSTPHFDWLERRCLGTNSVRQSIKIHSWHHRGDPALGRLRCFEGHLDIPETGCCICDVVTDATTCFSSRWPWQRPLTPGWPFKSCIWVKVVNYLSLVFSVRDVKSYHLWSWFRVTDLGRWILYYCDLLWLCEVQKKSDVSHGFPSLSFRVWGSVGFHVLS